MPTPEKLAIMKAWLEEHKAQHVESIDLAGKGAFTDALLVASATSVRHAQSLADGIAHATGTKCAVSHQSLPALVNDSGLCAALEGVFGSIPGLEFSVADAPVNGSEDFALVAERVPTAFLMLGVNVDGGVTNHNPRAVFYDDRLHLASALLAKAAAVYLEM